MRDQTHVQESDNRSSTRIPDDERTGSRATDVGASAVIGGAAAGVVAGALAGPVGAAVGAVIGAVAAGFAGNEIAASIDRSIEESHWRSQYRERPYVTPGSSFDDYGPAYGYGVDGFIKHGGRNFDEVETDLASQWPASRGASSLEWDRARLASRDAWDRVRLNRERAVREGSDRDPNA